MKHTLKAIWKWLGKREPEGYGVHNWQWVITWTIGLAALIKSFIK